MSRQDKWKSKVSLMVAIREIEDVLMGMLSAATKCSEDEAFLIEYVDQKFTFVYESDIPRLLDLLFMLPARDARRKMSYSDLANLFSRLYLAHVHAFGVDVRVW